MDKDWIINEIEQIAQFGKGGRGITRLAFSEADCAVRQYISKLLQDNGLAVRVDEIGNVIGRIEGSDPNVPVVVTGSHLDTVPEGGKYDGVVGVVGGLAAIKRLQERGPLTHPVELIVFVAEESSRFGVACIGSKVMAGAVNANSLGRVKDQEGITLAQILKEHGMDIAAIGRTVRDKSEIKAFVELHIDQSRTLEQGESKIGIVEAIAAPARCKITVEGVAAHSGTTPMDERQDALISAAMIILAIQEIAMEQSERDVVATVGVIKAYPGVMNVVPGLVEMWVDIRGVDHASIVECLQEIKDAVSTITERQNTSVSIEMLSSERPVQMDNTIIQLITDACQTKGISHQRMHSGAGHDAMNMARLTKAGMIFIPCRDGISHNPDEYTDAEDIVVGVDILTEVLYRIAK